MIQLNYRDSKPIYEQIKDGLRKLVISNSLSAHERLPSVRELAAAPVAVPDEPEEPPAAPLPAPVPVPLDGPAGQLMFDF